MAQYKTDFIDIDPDICSKEDLLRAIQHCDNLSGYYETKQLALKTFINSIYGATASKYFVGHNTDVAESITLQGQDLNHFSENSVNKYFRGIFQSREHYDKVIYVPIYEWMEKYDVNTTDEFYAKDKNKNWVKINLPVSKEDFISNNIDSETKQKIKKNVYVKTTFGQHLGYPFEQISKFTIDSGRLTSQIPLNHPSIAEFFTYMGQPTYLEDDPTTSLTIAGDTDSLIGSSTIFLDKNNISIEDAFNKCKLQNFDIVLKLSNGQEVVPVNGLHTTKAFDPNTPLLPVDRPIKYIMRHKVTKSKFKIKSSSGKEVIVTGDHSIMVIRNNELISIKAKDINIETDKLVEIVNNSDNR